MKKYIDILFQGFMLSTAVFSVVACADIVDIEDVEGKVIRLSAGKSYDVTRAATDIQGPVFEAGAEVNVFIKGTSATETTPIAIGNYPTVFTASAPVGNKNELIPPTGETPHYLIGDNSKVTITATYPTTVTSETTSFTVKYDQTQDADYKASDLMMVAPINHNKSGDIISLPFEHKMAKIIISAIGEPGITMDETIVLGNTTGAGNGTGIYRTASISVADGDFASGFSFDTNAGLSDRGSITMTNGGAVLIPPQTVTTADFITVTGHTNADPTPKECRFAISNKTFEAGKVYKLTVAISEDNFTTPETITGWTKDYGELTLMPSGGYQGVSIDAMDPVVYNGTEFTPKPDVWYGTADKIKLREGPTKDFIYQYVDNKNAGNAQVLVIGQNYYAGLAAVQGFVIKQASGKISFPEGTVRDGDDHTGIEFELNQQLDAIKVNNTGDGAVTYTAEKEDGSATDVVTVDPVEGTLVIQNIGTCYIRATTPSGVITGQNYYYTDGSDETAVNNTDRYKVVVKAKPATKDNFTVTYTPTSFTYNGTDQQLTTLTVSDGQHVLARDIDYEAELTNSKNVGNATLTITGKKNYNATFTIDIPVLQATPTITVDETTLTMGIHQNTAPMNRRKTRHATTENWASANLSYTSSDPSVATISEKGLITGLKAGTTTITVDVAADKSENANWSKATAKSYTVNVVSSDFDFVLRESSTSNISYSQLNDGTVQSDQRVKYVSAYAKWTCPASGTWQLDCWGAQGASTPTTWIGKDNAPKTAVNRGMGGRGAHIAGRVELKKGQVLYITIGEEGKNISWPDCQYTLEDVPNGKYLYKGYAWNGGANTIVGAYTNSVYNTTQRLKDDVVSGGGGATDMSLNYGTYGGQKNMIGYDGNAKPELAWRSDAHLYSRVIVAGGGGGALYYYDSTEGRGFADGGEGGAYEGGDGNFNDIGYGGKMDRGGFSGYKSNWYENHNGTNGSNSGYWSETQLSQLDVKKVYYTGPYAGGWVTSDGMFGEGGYTAYISEGNASGGGGWYGGGAGAYLGINGSGGGGSSFLWTKDLAKWYTTASSLKTAAKVVEWGNATFFDAPATKQPKLVPSSDAEDTNYFPYISEVIADAGVHSGDGKAMITAVELDDECISK